MNDRTQNASEIVSVSETERQDDVLYVFMDDFIVYSDDVVFQFVEILQGQIAYGATQIRDVDFDRVVAELVVDHFVDFVLLLLLCGVLS